MKRKEIIELLQYSKFKRGTYVEFKNYAKLPDTVDDWFKGVVNSLFYSVNRKALVLCGNSETENSEFLSKLLPKELEGCYASAQNPELYYYDKLIINYDFEGSAKAGKYIISDNFKITEAYTEFPVTEKRLASYCTTALTPKYFHMKRRFIVVEDFNVNLDIFNFINKLELWSEIFYLYNKNL